MPFDSEFDRAFRKLPPEARDVAGRWGEYVVQKLVLEFGLKMQPKDDGVDPVIDGANLEAYKALRALRDEFVERMRVL